jgi:predicted AAA+ superfamily ATPase
MNNYTQVDKGLRLLRDVLAPYIARELRQAHGADWWQKGVYGFLYEDQRRDLPAAGEWSKLVDSLDIQRCLLLFDLHWNEVFRKKLAIDHRTWAKELVGVRNRAAHLGGTDFSDDDTWRALDTMSRLCEQIDAESAEEMRAMQRLLRYGTSGGSTTLTEAVRAAAGNKTRAGGVLSQVPFAGLPSWREVMEPHPDVAQGRYRNAEFAADLAQVARGEGALEYRDPVEFFARTYVTAGMAGLIEQSLRRVTGKGGEPVIQLKTSFGGGKTHSMLALYHILRGRVAVESVPQVRPVLTQAGLASLPKVNVAVLVGTALDPSKAKRPQHMPGITINTLWGEMAAQLAEAAGQPELYELVREADKKGVSPGSLTLKTLFDAAAPCMVLMDEVVAYAKKLYGVPNLPAGSFDNLVSFIQELTEAARASKNSLVVASIPESDIEIGGEAGQKVLATIEHTFGRMEAIWKPVTAGEGFEVVRRRLFLDCKDEQARAAVCQKYSRMYAENPSDFPVETRELEYRERLVSCYPIHPEVFDRLYEDWATLERFQRTRGVLRLMAAVIHELWAGNDAGLMIMPGSLPLDVPAVRDELTRHLSEGWNGIVDREVDGRNSVPYQKDQQNNRYGSKLAARRVARAVLLGSAPTVRDQRVRGIEAARVRLGVVQPGESIADFNDALSTLQGTLAHLYTNQAGNRYWYDTRPTLRKTVDDRATQVPESDVEHEIETRLRKLRKEAPFGGLHICPGSSLDVPDEQVARLVILGPLHQYKASNPNNAALATAQEFLQNRGHGPRQYRNMLAFVAPDQDTLAGLKQEVRRFLAWKSVREDRESLNLDAAQIREADTSMERSNNTVDGRLQETYCWLLVPHIDRAVDIRTVVFQPTNLRGGQESVVAKAARAMRQNETLISKWAPLLLKMELDNLLWAESDHIAIKKLWEQLSTYCYLPRLASEDALIDAMREGINSHEFFAYAAGFDGTRYIDLKFKQAVGTIERSGLLVKVSAAQRQVAEIEAQKAEQARASASASGEASAVPSASVVVPVFYPSPTKDSSAPVHETPPAPAKDVRFFMSFPLNNTRINRDVQQVVEEIIQHLANADGSQLRLTLEVEAVSDQGFSPPIVRAVSENCRTLRVTNFGFVKE